jgi:hypothetical protein
MTYLTGSHIERRTFLRGMGAVVGLPFLDAMVPAGRIRGDRNQEVERPRLIAMEQSHGAAGCNEWGATQNLWSPVDTGRDFDLDPTSMRSLEPYKDYLTIISNTDARMAEAFNPQEIGGDHFRSTATFLTQAHAKQTEGSDVYAGTSLDQLYASRFGQDTPIPSMQLCIEPVDQSGGCPYNYSCVYTDSMSWKSPTEPLPMIQNPRQAFDQLFGAGGTAEERASRLRTRGSMLDVLVTRISELEQELGGEDRNRLGQYLTDVRELERRIQLTEARNASGEEREIPEAPAGVPDSFREHIETMFDLQVLAFQQDLTRVFTLKLSRDASARVYPESGVNSGFHPLSHHANNEEEILRFGQLNSYHVSMVPYLLEKLKNTMDGDTHLLDKTAIVYGSAMGDPNIHNHRRLPLFFAGKANGKLDGGVHLKAPDGTPMANAFLSLLHILGLDDLESFGDSTGAMAFNDPGTFNADLSGSGRRGSR